MELVTPSLLQLRRHIALKLGAGAAAGASVPARGIERPGSATDKGLARELVRAALLPLAQLLGLGR